MSEAKRLKQLEDENAKLKKLLAEQVLDVAALREVLSKKCGRARRASAGRHGPAASSERTGRWSSIAPAVLRTPRFAQDYAILPMSGGDLAIGDFSSCCGGTAKRPALSGKRPIGQHTMRPPQGCRKTGSDFGRSEAERALVAGPRARSVR